MSLDYESEQKELTAKVIDLKQKLESTKEQSLNIDLLLALVKKYSEIKTLDAEIIRDHRQNYHIGGRNGKRAKNTIDSLFLQLHCSSLYPR